MSTDNLHVARELRACLHSTLGMLEAVCEDMKPGSNGFALRALIEGGMPETMDLADTLVVSLGGDTARDSADLSKSFARGYQSIVLMRREEETGVRDPQAWKQDPDEFYKEMIANGGA